MEVVVVQRMDKKYLANIRRSLTRKLGKLESQACSHCGDGLWMAEMWNHERAVSEWVLGEIEAAYIRGVAVGNALEFPKGG